MKSAGRDEPAEFFFEDLFCISPDLHYLCRQQTKTVKL